MTRLIFVKNQDGTQYTTKETIAREKIIRGCITINVDGLFNYYILDVGNGNFLANGTIDNFSKTKSLIKTKFKELGVIFDNEIRKKVG